MQASEEWQVHAREGRLVPAHRPAQAVLGEEASKEMVVHCVRGVRRLGEELLVDDIALPLQSVGVEVRGDSRFNEGLDPVPRARLRQARPQDEGFAGSEGVALPTQRLQDLDD